MWFCMVWDRAHSAGSSRILNCFWGCEIIMSLFCNGGIWQIVFRSTNKQTMYFTKQNTVQSYLYFNRRPELHLIFSVYWRIAVTFMPFKQHTWKNLFKFLSHQRINMKKLTTKRFPFCKRKVTKKKLAKQRTLYRLMIAVWLLSVPEAWSELA